MRDSQLSLATSVGEGRESLSMLWNIFNTAEDNIKRLKAHGSKTQLRNVRNLLRDAKHLKKDLVLHPLQTVGSLWLGWSVGLAPLLSDCEAFVNHVVSSESEMAFYGAKARAAGVDKQSSAGWVHERSFRVQYGVNYLINDPHQFENWRLGLVIRPSLAWELVTLSFVVDYFINIGQYLELFEASILNNGITFTNGYKTTSTRDVWTFADAAVATWRPTQYWEDHNFPVEHSIRASRVVTTKNRTAITSFPRPSTPSVKLPKASTALLNLAALLAQLLERRVL
jgi:hypothetical protein